MTDAYLLLVNVDSGSIEHAEKNDDVWSAVFAQNIHQETTIITQETLTIVEHSDSN